MLYLLNDKRGWNGSSPPNILHKNPNGSGSGFLNFNGNGSGCDISDYSDCLYPLDAVDLLVRLTAKECLCCID